MIKEWIMNKGYVRCKLNGKPYLKHRIIAQQFIPNPNNLSEIDHINHNKTDNRIENLIWCNRSENNKNRSGQKHYKYTFFDELPETAEPLDAYNGWEFDGLYIDYENKKLYLFNGIKYRELLSSRNKGNIYYVVSDIENKRRALSHKVLFG